MRIFCFWIWQKIFSEKKVRAKNVLLHFFRNSVYIVSKKLPLIWYYWISTLSFTVGLFFSTWHVGIEQKILPGLSGCTNTINTSQSLTMLKDQIFNQKIIACDEITWSLMGLSAATLNSLLLILLLLINTIFLVQHRYGKEKKI